MYEIHDKVNSSNFSGLEHSLCSYTRSNRREVGEYIKGEETALLSGAMRVCPHCTEKSERQFDRFCSRGRGSVRAATAGTVAPSHLLLKFGKLTIEFETLFQFRKAESRRPSVAAYGKVVP